MVVKGWQRWKGGLHHAEHAVIYTGDTSPEGLPGEPVLGLKPIQVLPKTSRDKLAPECRINYAKIYTVEHNVKVAFFGKISKDSERRFIVDFDSVWESKPKFPTDRRRLGSQGHDRRSHEILFYSTCIAVVVLTLSTREMPKQICHWNSFL